MGNRENDEIQKAIAEFLRKLEASQKDKSRAENRGKPAGNSPKSGCRV